jgi:hypothetical protein
MNAANTQTITTGGPGASGCSPGRKTNERGYALLIVGWARKLLGVEEPIDNIDFQHQLPNGGFNHLSIALS